VFIDPMFLKTLSERELKSGLVEIIKHSIIRDAELFEHIEQNLDLICRLEPDILEIIIERSCKIKAEIVSLDEKEQGIRILLNFGHTAGHAVEKLGNYKEIRHGEGIGFGIIIASHIGMKLGYLSITDYERICNLIFKIVPVRLFPDIEPSHLIESMELDKKKSKGKLRFVLPDGIGSAICTSDIPMNLVNESVNEIIRIKNKSSRSQFSLKNQ
jgi:3-dehydroquinate synthase